MRGIEGAEKNVAKLQSYIAGLKEDRRRLPARAGDVNRSKIASACGFNRSVLYDNEIAIQVIEHAKREIGLEGPKSKPTGGVQITQKEDKSQSRELHRLQQLNATLRAENQDLRKRLREYDHIEERMIQTGRRIIPNSIAVDETEDLI